MRCKRIKNLTNHIAALELHYVQLAMMRSKLEDSMQVAIMMATLKDLNKNESLVTSVNIITEKDSTWRQVSTLFIKKAELLNGK